MKICPNKVALLVLNVLKSTKIGQNLISLRTFLKMEKTEAKSLLRIFRMLATGFQIFNLTCYFLKTNFIQEFKNKTLFTSDTDLPKPHVYWPNEITDLDVGGLPILIELEVPGMLELDQPLMNHDS